MAVPATAVKVAGLAATPDGALYVQSLGVAVGDTITGGVADGAMLFQSGTGASAVVAASADAIFNDTTNVLTIAGGVTVTSGSLVASNLLLSNTNAGDIFLGTSSDASIGRGGIANSIIFAGTGNSEGIAASRTEVNKPVTAFTDNAAKAVLTFTVPNSAQSASFLVTVVGTLGAGGAIGANESTRSATYRVDITRTAGVNAVATISSVYTQAAAATVAGGADITTVAALSAISGAVGATNTFTVDATLTKASGASDNHTALVNLTLLNANSSGITVA